MSANRKLLDVLRETLADANELRDMISRECPDGAVPLVAATAVIEGIDRALRVVETERA